MPVPKLVFYYFKLAEYIPETNQQDAQQQFGIDGGTPSLAVAVLEPLTDEGQADVSAHYRQCTR
jgi:hypothetical protein